MRTMVMIMAALLVAAPLAAQRGGRAQIGSRVGVQGQRGMAMMARRGPGALGPVERALRQREALNLTEAQVAQLEALRAEAVARRVTHAQQMRELRSQVRSGQLDAATLRQQMQQQRAARRASQVRANPLTDILTEEQLAQLNRRGPGGRGPALTRRGVGPRVQLRAGRGIGRAFRPGFRRARVIPRILPPRRW